MVTYLNSLHRLIYVSRASDFVTTRSADVMADILRAAVRRNERAGVTGALLACDQWFVQALEGSRIKVGEVYGVVCNDDRHENIRVIEAKPVEGRLFAEWGMCGETLSPRDASIVRLLGARGLDHSSLTAGAALKLLSVVRDIQGRAPPVRYV